MKYIYIIFNILCHGWFIIFGFLLYHLYDKSFKPYKAQFREEFYTTLPSEITPIELSNLMYQRVNACALSAEVVRLFNNGVLKIVNDNDNEYIMIDKFNTRDFSTGQDYTVKLLLNIIGDGNRVSIKEINKFCDRKKNCDIFLLEYNIWNKIMRKESFNHIFYETKDEYGLVKFVALIGGIIFLTNILGRFNLGAGYFIIAPAIFLMIYFTKIYKRTREANEEYHKWLAFKHFLENINLFEYAIADPDKYIMYGTCLGVKGLEQKLTNHDYFERISDALNKCVVKSILNGNRKII